MRKFIAFFIGCIPVNFLRIYLYKLLLGYQISYSARIGWLNVIYCRRCKIETGSRIGNLNRIYCDDFQMRRGSELRRFNKIILVRKFELEEGCIIVSFNKFVGHHVAANPFKEYCNFRLGENSVITSSHYIDLTDQVIVGKNVVFGGIHSKIWTHGFDLQRTRVQAPVLIHNNIYVGADSTLLQGVVITNDVIIGASSIVSKSIDRPGFYISGELVRKADCPVYSTKEEVRKVGDHIFYRK